ncbi:thrombopoietin receptor isoform X1 [Hippoglossus hippoglossus]|uniref:thrombopoietin receptor isoform X1 n=1 Tax=Hippoglossus hippoglossus TaxID=8267 RepID=UPI00148C8DE3|nr:thrombopoietin receptor isoform X1 [Hippoglossus hippoglossus]
MLQLLVIPRTTMNLCCRWEMLLIISLWSQVNFVPGTYCEDAAVSHLSKEDVLLLKDEQDPKCFTRTGEDFTCFFEAADNRTYDLLYKLNSVWTGIRCDVSVQKSEDDTFLHICSFPPADVLLYVETHVEVVEHNSSSSSLFNRTVSVEDHFLLDPPLNVSLHQTGQAGQLLVSWRAKVPTYCGDAMYRVRYFNKGVGEKTEEVKQDEYNRFILDSLVPGEQTEVQVSVKCAPTPSEGHWSRWSQPVRGIVPQSADDVSLVCFTSDLQNVTCHWNRSRYGLENYKLFYEIDLSDEWSECTTDGFTDMCRFHGDESRKVRIRLSSAAAPLGRTFFTGDFTLNNTIKTSAPDHLRGAVETNQLCLKWEAPLLSVAAHLQYEVGYRTRPGGAWKRVSVEGPEPGTCLEVSAGNQYHVRVRAKPDGSVYSGLWSDWSQELTGRTPTDPSLWLMLCVPFSMLITVSFLISAYLSRLKQLFWPPLPNLDKVLHNFLTDIDKQRWDPPLTLKQWSEETTESVLEIISEDVRKPSEESTQLRPPEETPSSREPVDGIPGAEVFPDYVTLNKECVILCPMRNKYMYETDGETQGRELEVKLLQTCGCSVPQCSAIDFLNFSYEPLADAPDRLDCRVPPVREPGNIYTNLPCS